MSQTIDTVKKDGAAVRDDFVAAAKAYRAAVRNVLQFVEQAESAIEDGALDGSVTDGDRSLGKLRAARREAGKSQTHVTNCALALRQLCEPEPEQT